LLDLSGKLDRELILALSHISEAADRAGIRFLLVGATARNLMLEVACGVRVARATYDVDIAVRVASWVEYERLGSELQDNHQFVKSISAPHRLQTSGLMTVDLIPFGPIAGEEEKIAWPPEGNWVLNVEGFECALNHADEVLIRSVPHLSVNVTSLPAQAVLKTISWDSNPARGKDAFDLYIIIAHYLDTPNLDRLATDARDLVTEPPSPLHEIGAELLGRDMAGVCDDLKLAGHIGAILSRETAPSDKHTLISAMIPAAGSSTSPDEILALLQLLQRGFRTRAL